MSSQQSVPITSAPLDSAPPAGTLAAGSQLSGAPDTGIVTPEAVVLEFQTAGAGSRIIAESLDLLLQFSLLFALILAMAFGIGFSGSEGAAWALVAIFFVLVMLIFFGYPIAMETLWNGRTLGKAAMGTRVVTEEGGPIRFRHAAIRGLIGFFEIIVFFGLPALLAIILSRKNQRLGDMVGGTILLRERDAASRAAVAVAFPSPPGFESYVASLDVGTISTEQYGVIRSFLMRVFELTPAARATLAVRVANPVAVMMNHDPPPMVGPELFLACVASAYQQRHGGGQPMMRPPVPGFPQPGYPQPGYPQAVYPQQPPGYPQPPTGYGRPAGYGAPTGYGPPAGHGPPTAPAPPSVPASPAPGRYGQIDPNAFPGDPNAGRSF